MNVLNKLSELTSIDTKYWMLIIKTLLFWIFLDIIKRVIIRCFKKMTSANDNETIQESFLRVDVAVGDKK